MALLAQQFMQLQGAEGPSILVHTPGLGEQRRGHVGQGEPEEVRLQLMRRLQANGQPAFLVQLRHMHAGWVGLGWRMHMGRVGGFLGVALDRQRRQAGGGPS